MATNSNPLQALAAKSQAAPSPADQPQNSPAPQAQPQQNAPDQPTPDATEDSSSSKDETAGAPVSLHRAYSKLNSCLTALIDGLGVRRSASIPYVHGESTASHIKIVGDALQRVGGITGNLITTSHSAAGRGFGSGDGETAAYPSQKLLETLIPKDCELAIKALSAERNLISKIEGLTGETDSVKVAKAQLALVSKNGGSGMNLSDFASALLAIPGPVIQDIARQHDLTKPDGHHAKLRAAIAAQK